MAYKEINHLVHSQTARPIIVQQGVQRLQLVHADTIELKRTSITFETLSENGVARDVHGNAEQAENSPAED